MEKNRDSHFSENRAALPKHINMFFSPQAYSRYSLSQMPSKKVTLLYYAADLFLKRYSAELYGEFLLFLPLVLLSLYVFPVMGLSQLFACCKNTQTAFLICC